MKVTALFSILLVSLFSIHAQELNIYQIELFERNEFDTLAFSSFSDSYNMGDIPDSLIIPDMEGKTVDEVQYFVLDGKYRKSFLNGTAISETDKVFIYDYATDKLITFNVTDLNVVACINSYAGNDDFPYDKEMYRFGFGFDKSKLTGLNDLYYSTVLVYVGKENPFVRRGLEPIVWKKYNGDKLEPLIERSSRSAFLYEPDFKILNVRSTYTAEIKNYQFFIQNLDVKDVSNEFEEYELLVRQLLVIDSGTQEVVCDRMYFEGESSGHAPLNGTDPENQDIYQWAGKLFKYKPTVFLGFQFEAFGCSEITFLNTAADDVYIKCDNRH